MSTSQSEAEILKWLSRTGFPFELRVGHAFRTAGWFVDHGKWYMDAITGKSREVDLHVVRWVTSPDESRSVALHLVVECKTSSDKPWIAFTAPGATTPYAWMERVVDGLSSDVVLAAVANSVDLPSFLLRPPQTCHAITRAHAENKAGDPSAPYAALQGVISAAMGIGRKNSEMSLLFAPRRYDAHITIPLVVVDGLVYECSLGEDKPHLTLVPETVVQTSRPDNSDRVSVSIIAGPSLETFIRNLTESAMRFCNALLPHVEAVYTAHRATEARRSVQLIP